jgi:hypothetical protein
MRKLFPYFLSAVVTASFSQLASAQGVSTQQAGDQNQAAQSGERTNSSTQGRTGPNTQQAGDQNEAAQSGDRKQNRNAKRNASEDSRSSAQGRTGPDDRSAGGGSSARNPSPATPLPR